MRPALRPVRRRARAPHGRCRAACCLLLASVVLVGACDDGGGRPDRLTADEDGPNTGVVPTIPGGVELAATDPAAVLVGEGLAYGTPLPSEQAAADAFVAEPAVDQVIRRRAFEVASGRHVGDVLVLQLDGSQIFDEGVLTAFERAVVAGLAGGETGELALAGRTALRASDATGRTVIAYREGNLLVLVVAPTDADATNIASRQLEARAFGAVGSLDAATPLTPLPTDAAFVAVPSVTFTPFLPPEEELTPIAPELPGALEVQGRYGVVAGERRSIVWAFAVDPATYPTAEALAPALEALVSSRAGGAPVQAAELGGHVVLSATGIDGAPSAQVFRQQGLVLLVEGAQPEQLDAVTSAWVAALGPT